ncbi:cell division protein ZapE, partial [Salmonella enterica subsp. enterica serovar Kentucky]|nr:cell division protein ZapE [Salmonella enterica subsp. enterica serovar Kentucky]
SPTSRYLQALNEGTHQPDDVQKEAVDRLETLYQALTAKKSSAGKFGRYGLRRCFDHVDGDLRLAGMSLGISLVITTGQQRSRE